jgi:hypothetical protein
MTKMLDVNEICDAIVGSTLDVSRQHTLSRQRFTDTSKMSRE